MIKKGIVEHGNTDYVFMLENWVPANNEEAIKIRPQLKNWAAESISQTPFYFCSQFNTTTRKCMDYDNRPSVCKRYPYSGLKKLPIADLMLRVSIGCGYALAHPDYNKHIEEIEKAVSDE